MALCFIFPIVIKASESNKSSSSRPSFIGVRSFSLGVGNLSRFDGKIQVDEDGNTNSMEFLPFISTSFYYDLHPRWSVNPEFIIAVPEKGRDRKIKKNQFYLLGHMAYRILDQTQLRLGAGLSFYRISSDGGTQRLRNGPDYVDFPMPEISNVATNFIITPSVEHLVLVMEQPISFKFQGYIYNLLESEARAFAYTFSAHYHFKSVDWGRHVQR